jgi:hypothetical protein
VTALFLGFFSAVWFGWAEADPPEWLRVWLGVGITIGWLVALVGAIVGFRSSGETSAMRDRTSRARYGKTVGVEFALVGVGAAVLGLAGLIDFIPVWVCAVVGAHFFPLASILRQRMLYPLGIALCAVAVAGLFTTVISDISASTIVGVSAGLLLFAYAVTSLAHAFFIADPH